MTNIKKVIVHFCGNCGVMAENMRPELPCENCDGVLGDTAIRGIFELAAAIQLFEALGVEVELVAIEEIQ